MAQFRNTCRKYEIQKILGTIYCVREFILIRLCHFLPSSLVRLSLITEDSFQWGWSSRSTNCTIWIMYTLNFKQQRIILCMFVYGNWHSPIAWGIDYPCCIVEPHKLRQLCQCLYKAILCKALSVSVKWSNECLKDYPLYTREKHLCTFITEFSPCTHNTLTFVLQWHYFVFWSLLHTTMNMRTVNF